MELAFNINELLDDIKDKVYPKKPPICPTCLSIDVDEVEIIGAHDKALFWECLNCSEFFLRYDKEETKKYLDKANDLFIDVNDDTMEALCQERPN